MSKPAAILLSNIPAHLLDKYKIQDVFENFTSDLRSILINPDYESLAKIIELRDAAVEAFETAITKQIAKFVREQGRPTRLPATARPYLVKIANISFSLFTQICLKGKTFCLGLVGIPYHQSEDEIIGHLKDTINEANYRISELRSDPDQLPLLNSAFLIFNNSRTVELASRLLVSDRPRQMTLRFVGCSAESIIWPAVGTSWLSSYVRTLVVTATLATLYIG